MMKEHVMKGLTLLGIGLSMVALVSAAACTKRPTTLGPDPGLAYTMARDHQTLNPEAGNHLDPIQGLADATAAKNTLERYRSSFEKPEGYRTTITAPSVVNQGIG